MNEVYKTYSIGCISCRRFLAFRGAGALLSLLSFDNVLVVGDVLLIRHFLVQQFSIALLSETVHVGCDALVYDVIDSIVYLVMQFYWQQT